MTARIANVAPLFPRGGRTRPAPAPRAAVAALALLAALHAAASLTDDFLEGNYRLAVGQGAAPAYVALTNYMATAGLSPAEAAKCKGQLVELLCDLERPGAAANEFTEGLLMSRQARADTIVAALRKCLGVKGGLSNYRRQSLCRAALAHPALAAKTAERAAALRALARIYVARSFCDLAYGAFLEAADCYPADAPSNIASTLFEAASCAQLMRDIDAAGACFRRIQKLEGLPYATARLAQLREGTNYILIDQFDWKPSAQRLAKADELIGKAISARPSAIKPHDAYEARVSLMKAYRCAGRYDKAIEIGISLVDNRPEKVSGQEASATAQYLGDTLDEAGQYKLAIRYYEMVTSGNLKNLHKKIGNTARRAGDYVRAIQAYTDALPYCDWVEGKDEIAQLKRMAATLSRAVRDKAKATSAEDLFSEESEEITNLSLDEL